MTVPPMPVALQNILDWQRAHQGQVIYSQTDPGRLDASASGLVRPSDCSGLIAKLFEHFAGIDIGTYTGNECFFGELVTTSKADAAAGRGMLPGDCILFDWDGGTWDHIAMYAGNGRIWNHGGPGRGPNDWSLYSNVNSAVDVMVRRFLPWTEPTLLEKLMALDPNDPDYKKLLTDVGEIVDERLVDLLHFLGGGGNGGGSYGAFTQTSFPLLAGVLHRLSTKLVPRVLAKKPAKRPSPGPR